MINISKRETIHLKCKAYGHVSDVDMRHKPALIIKNLREGQGGEQEGQAERRRRRSKEES